MTRLRAASDVGPAEWVVAGLRGFGESVLSLVPTGFPAYVRVFHPAYRQASTEGILVREIDLATTYIGCDDACRDEILTLPEVEALPIDPATGINFRSDLRNPFDQPSASAR